jgi:hypothetical protein
MLGQALALVSVHGGNVGSDAAQSGDDIVNVVHQSDQFSGCGHGTPLIAIRLQLPRIPRANRLLSMEQEI